MAAGDFSFPEGYEIYDDDAAFGKEAPSLKPLVESGNWLKDDPVDFKDGGKPTVLLFWAKYAKGEYRVIEAVSKLFDARKEEVNVVGVSVDLEKKDAEKYLSKLGTEMAEQRVVLSASFPCAWDEGKQIHDQFKDLCGVSILGPSSVFLVDKDGNIVWRERFSSSHEWKDGIFEKQLERHLKGEDLISVGKTPEDEAGAEEEIDADGDDDFDLF